MFEDLLKAIGDPSTMDREILGHKADAYYERLFKLSGICYHLHVIDPEQGQVMLKKFLPIMEMLSDEVGKDLEEYQKKHGEL